MRAFLTALAITSIGPAAFADIRVAALTGSPAVSQGAYFGLIDINDPGSLVFEMTFLEGILTGGFSNDLDMGGGQRSLWFWKLGDESPRLIDVASVSRWAVGLDNSDNLVVEQVSGHPGGIVDARITRDGKVFALINESASESVWTKQDDEWVRLIGQGDEVAGLGEGATILDGPTAIQLSIDDKLSFVAYVSGPGIYGKSHWALINTEPTPIIVEGIGPDGREWSGLGECITARDSVYFSAFLREPDETQSREGIWRWVNGNIEPVLRAGDLLGGFYVGNPRPGLGPDLGIAKWSASEDVGLAAAIVSDSGPLLVTGTPGNLRVVAARGDPAPGTEPGTLFRTFDVERAPLINRHGHLLFKAYVEGPSVVGSHPDPGRINAFGVWGGNTRGLALVLRAGESFPVGPDDVRTVLDLKPADLNDSGQFALRSFFNSVPMKHDVAYAMLVGDVPLTNLSDVHSSSDLPPSTEGTATPDTPSISSLAACPATAAGLMAFCTCGLLLARLKSIRARPRASW